MIRRIAIFIISIIIAGCSLLHAQQKGMASYYSKKVHGRRMSNGEKYHRDSMTCAHATFPLGTMLKVTNLKNGKLVIVKVTDRCRRHARRIIDLSLAAAKELDIIRAGVSMVSVEHWNEERPFPYRNDTKPEIPEIDFEELIPQKGITNLKPTWK